jgi:rhomboid protease GluP
VNAAVAEFKLRLKEITPNISAVPLLIVLNLGALMGMAATGTSVVDVSGEEALKWGANLGVLTLGGQPWRLLTGMFVHFGYVELLVSMVVLVGVGPVIERLFGPVHFLAIYLVSGLVGGLANVLAQPTLIGGGSSASILGVVGALGALALLRRGAIPPAVLIRLGAWLAIVIAFDITLKLIKWNVDIASQLGGLVGGAVIGALLLRPLVPGRATGLKRLLVVAGASSWMVVTVALVLPRPVTFASVYRDYVDEDHRLVHTYNEVGAEMNAQRLTRKGGAHQLDALVLPGFQRIHAKLASETEELQQQSLTPRETRVLELLARLASSREEAVVQEISALRAGDEERYSRTTHETAQQCSNIQDEIASLIGD